MSDKESATVDLQAFLGARPALKFLITTPGDGTWLYGPGSGECSGCPFAEYAGHPDDEHRGDPAKNDYDCSLLGRRVWGAAPACTRLDWQGRALDELEGTAR